MKKELLKANHNIITNYDLLDSLLQLDIKNNDTLCIHTEIFSFGIPILKKDEFLQEICECFKQIIGKNGTLIMPTFTYSFCNNEIYDKQNSKSTMGILTEFFRKMQGVIRTNDPIFSFAVFGKNEYLQDSKSCFGKNSLYERLHANNGKIVLFGNKNLGYTFTHYIEEQLQVPYRFYKNFTGFIIDENGNKKEKSIDYYVRKLDESSDLSINKQIQILKNSQNFRICNFANSVIVAIEAKKYYDETAKALKQNSKALIEV